jgi:hypothetical protein
MAPVSTTILLNDAVNHSITFIPSDDSVTANLPDPLPIEKVSNKRKLLLLIYFVQRDLERNKSPRKVDAEVSMELRIVERLIWQFSNYTQAMRTLRESTEIGDRIDTTQGTAPSRTEKDAFGKGTKAIKMTITKEARDILAEWFRDILAPNVDSPDDLH